MMQDNLHEQIERLKEELASKYIMLLSATFLLFFIIYMFIIVNRFLAYYILAGLIFLIYTWILIYKRYPINRIVHFYFILSPWYMSYIILKYWNVTMVNFMWISLLPLGAFIFFGRKTIIAYTLYAILFIITLFIIANSSLINIEPYPRMYYTAITDILVIICNMLTIGITLFYKDKIRNIRILIDVIEDEMPIITPHITSKKESERYEILFEKIEESMIKNMYFKDPYLNLFNLCAYMNINSGYVSKTIRYKGYTNFNHYLNLQRINYAKKLISEYNLQKVTLMYIYTESGFRSQSTFNRAFKQIENSTPSEYIQKLKNNGIDSISEFVSPPLDQPV